MTESIDYIPFTTATLAEWGWDFVVADVEDFGDAFFNTSDGSRPSDFPRKAGSDPNPGDTTMIFTPVNVVIDTAISGPSKTGSEQVVIEGGTVGCFVMRVSPVPQVKPGSRYVFVLSEAHDAEGKTLQGRKARFAWQISSDMVSTPDGPMTIDELAAIVVKATPSSEPAT